MSDYSSEEEVRVQKGEGAQGAPPPGRMPGQEQDRTIMMLARGRGNALRALPSHTSPDHRDSCPCQKITTALTPELSALFPHVWPENL